MIHTLSLCQMLYTIGHSPIQLYTLVLIILSSVEAMSKGDAFIGMDDGMEEVNEKKKEQNIENLVQKGNRQ